MRAVATFVILVLIGVAGVFPANAAPSEDVACVQRFLTEAGFDEIGAADGVIGKKTIAAGTALSQRFKIDTLPQLSAETAAAWCSFTTSPGAVEIAQLARYRLYPISLKAVEPVDPFAFDFSPYKAAGIDRMACNFNIFRTDRGSGEVDTGPMVSGRVVFEASHMVFGSAYWQTGGLANPESFQTARLMIAEGPKLVGKVELFHQWADSGQVPVPAELVTIKKSTFEPGRHDLPEGRYTFIINAQHGGVFELRLCRPKAG